MDSDSDKIIEWTEWEHDQKLFYLKAKKVCSEIMFFITFVYVFSFVYFLLRSI